MRKKWARRFISIALLPGLGGLSIPSLAEPFVTPAHQTPLFSATALAPVDTASPHLQHMLSGGRPLTHSIGMALRGYEKTSSSLDIIRAERIFRWSIGAAVLLSPVAGIVLGLVWALPPLLLAVAGAYFHRPINRDAWLIRHFLRAKDEPPAPDVIPNEGRSLTLVGRHDLDKVAIYEEAMATVRAWGIHHDVDVLLVPQTSLPEGWLTSYNPQSRTVLMVWWLLDRAYESSLLPQILGYQSSAMSGVAKPLAFLRRRGFPEKVENEIEKGKALEQRLLRHRLEESLEALSDNSYVYVAVGETRLENRWTVSFLQFVFAGTDTVEWEARGRLAEYPVLPKDTKDTARYQNRWVPVVRLRQWLRQGELHLEPHRPNQNRFVIQVPAIADTRAWVLSGVTYAPGFSQVPDFLIAAWARWNGESFLETPDFFTIPKNQLRLDPSQFDFFLDHVAMVTPSAAETIRKIGLDRFNLFVRPGYTLMSESLSSKTDRLQRIEAYYFRRLSAQVPHNLSLHLSVNANHVSETATWKEREGDGFVNTEDVWVRWAFAKSGESAEAHAGWASRLELWEKTEDEKAQVWALLEFIRGYSMKAASALDHQLAGKYLYSPYDYDIDALTEQDFLDAADRRVPLPVVTSENATHLRIHLQILQRFHLLDRLYEAFRAAANQMDEISRKILLDDLYRATLVYLERPRTYGWKTVAMPPELTRFSA